MRLKTMLALVLGATFACNQSPTAPHERFTLQGQVVAADGTAAKALRAEIAETNLFAQTDAGGRFSLSGAPQGPATLHLSGPGVDTSLQLPGLDDGLVVRIAVGLSNDGNAFLKGPPEVQLRGTVASANGGDLRVAASTIHVDGNTTFAAGSLSSLSRLVGQVVDIQGLQAANGSIQAVAVNGGGNKNEIRFTAAIDAISGGDLTVNGFTVHTTSATKFSGGKPNVTSVAGLHAGDTVEVKGSLLADGSVAAAEVKVRNAAPPAPPPPPPPAPPVANAGANQAVASDALVTLDGSASADPTGIAVSFQWSQTAGPVVTLSSATVAQPTFSAPTVAFGQPAAILTFSLVVSDVNGTSAPSNVNVTVNPQPPPPPPPPPAPPIADAGPDQAVASAAFVTLDGSASSDPAGLSLTFSWTQTAGPIVTLSNATVVNPTFTAPAVKFNLPAAVLTFQLVVSDANASSAAASVNVTVSPEAPPPAPIANAGVNQAVASGAIVTLDGTASSGPAGLPLTFAWSQSSGPAVVLTGADTATPSFTAPVVPAGTPAATLGFSLVVSDKNFSSNPASVTVTVNPEAQNFPPPPGTPPPAPPNPLPLPVGGNGSNRFEVGAANGLYLQDPTPGEPTVQGFVVVTLGAAGGGLPGNAPADAVVTMNGVPLLRDPNLNGNFFRLDPAGPQPVIGSGGQMVIVATGTDPKTGKAIQRQLVMDCPTDISVTSTPDIGASLAGSPTVTVTSASNITFNVGVPIVASVFPQATLIGYNRAARTLAPSGSPHNIGPGPLSITVPVTPTAADAYLLDLRWPGVFVLDGQTGGFCGLAKRWTYTK